MQIAVIGWGSLIWCPGSLQIKTKWHADGPPLPIEFARKSEDGRLTLVIHPCSRNVQTYWAMSAFDTLDKARKNLCEREGSCLEKIGRACASGDVATEDFLGKKYVLPWLKIQKIKQNVDAAVWTALDSNWDFNLNDAECYLSGLKTSTYARACEYIRNAPEQIRTNLRDKLQKKNDDFKAATLPAVLFEER
jgi:hypothetical protein